MASRPPQRNLPPDSERWGRWVEDRITESAQERRQLEQRAANNNAGVNGSLGQLSGQVATLSSLVQSQITAAAGTGSGSAFSVPTTWTTVATATVPSNVNWAGSAQIAANGFVRATFNPAEMGDDFYYFMRFAVNGVASGIEVPCTFNATTGENVATAAHFTVTSNGTTNTVQLQVRSMRAAWYPVNAANSAILEVTTTYLR